MIILNPNKIQHVIAVQFNKLRIDNNTFQVNIHAMSRMLQHKTVKDK